MDAQDDAVTRFRASLDQLAALTGPIAGFVAEYRRHLLAAGFPEEEAANLTADMHELWWERQLQANS